MTTMTRMIRNNYNIYTLMGILFVWNIHLLITPSSVLVSAYINPKLLKETAASPTTTLDPRNVNVSSPRSNQKQQQRERIPFVWKTSISLPEIIASSPNKNRLVWLSEPDYCIVSETFQVPKNNNNNSNNSNSIATKDQDDDTDDRPNFCVKLYPQRLMETAEYSSSSSSSSSNSGSSSSSTTMCLSLQYLGDTNVEQNMSYLLPSYYYDTTFCVRWSQSSSSSSSHHKHSDDSTTGTSDEQEMFEWKGGKRFGSITPKSGKDEIFSDAVGIFSTVTVPVAVMDDDHDLDRSLLSSSAVGVVDDYYTKKKKTERIVDLEVTMTIHGSRLIKSSSTTTSISISSSSSSSSSPLQTTTISSKVNNASHSDDNEGTNDGLVSLSSQERSSSSSSSPSTTTTSKSNQDPKWWKKLQDPKWFEFWQDYNKVEYKEEQESWLMTGVKAAQFQDVRHSSQEEDPTAAVPASASTAVSASSSSSPSKADRLRVGSTVIPLLSTQDDLGFVPTALARPLRILVSTLFSATMLGGSWINVPTSIMKPHRSMWDKGVYPGIDYEITRISTTTSSTSTASSEQQEQELFYHQADADYEVRPLYPLGAFLERDWPVKINEKEIPNLISPLQYNIATAIGALTASASILSTFFVLSLATSLFFIPTRSMEPTLNVGDVVLVEKITPRIPFLNNFQHYRPGDVVLFKPPSALRDLVEANGGKLSTRDLFVKRIAAVAGDIVEIEANGDVTVFNNKGVFQQQEETPLRNLCGAEPLGLIKKYIKPGITVVPAGNVLLLGDCSSVSVDGRVWGTLNTKEIVGRPVVRTWPPARAGVKIADLPTTSTTTSSTTTIPTPTPTAPIVDDVGNQWDE